MKKSSRLPYHKAILPIEMRLLILCSVQDVSEEQKKIIGRLLQRPVDWDSFYQMAIKNRVYPIVYKNLKRFAIENMDRYILKELEDDYKKSHFDAFLQTNELIKVMELLKKQDIEIIAIKGPPLAFYLYHDISMRASRDLDILASPSDITRIDKFLLEAGYTKDCNAKQLSIKQETLLIKNFHHFSYRNDLGIQLELHWRLLGNNYDIPFEDLLPRKSEIVLFGKSLPVLSKEDNLIYLILHGSGHAWKRLRWICDIYEMVKNNALDWNIILQRAKELEMLHLLEQTMILLKILFRYKATINPILTKHDRRIANELAALSIPFITGLDDVPEIYGHSLYGNYKKYMLKWNTGADKKIHYFVSHLIPNAEDFQELKLQDSCFFLYYLLHFYKLLKRCTAICTGKITNFINTRKE
jgi:hypothetical protein